MKQWLAALVGLPLGACSLAFVVGSSSPPAAPDPDPDYRQFVADSLKGQFSGGPPPSDPQISALLPTAPLQPGDWFACLKGTQKGEEVFYALFFRDHGIASVRQAVEIDHCDTQLFGPLPPPTAPKKPPDKADAKRDVRPK